jgi:hypothetical protein
VFFNEATAILPSLTGNASYPGQPRWLLFTVIHSAAALFRGRVRSALLGFLLDLIAHLQDRR